ncbi:OLC1v1026845C1 [Oldenlandia corymbosa var. corymbosa]|uniref:protein-serine/threonine phosphatase n=1 Tax=Oldenlandia corymbosa var. corymbosa TaxID=529605 RepID=A0AAV1C8A3_OLDCO|nr:OLC1v1026845C1 [Oldenlandia corymbosa var. corymbosa]
MSSAVAIAANSPVFTLSPRPRISPIFCKPSTSLSPSPLSPSPSSSPLSPFTTLRLQKQASLLSNFSNSLRYESNCQDRNDPIECSTSSPSTSTATLLKRKRPARINVPISPVAFTDSGNQSPQDCESLNDVDDVGEGYAVYCKRGKKRGAMEDRHAAIVGLLGDSKKAIFSVFDGHGGAKAAEFAARNLNDNIVNKLSNRNDASIVEAVEEGYLTTDAECMKEVINGGACSVTALIHEGNLVISNAGDCRAVISRSGVAEALTVDHRPSRQDEKDRIEAMGGYVDCCHGVWRIQGSLAVSRAIGDSHLKQWVIAKPDTKISKIEADSEFLILATDGLWDKVHKSSKCSI